MSKERHADRVRRVLKTSARDALNEYLADEEISKDFGLRCIKLNHNEDGKRVVTQVSSLILSQSKVQFSTGDPYQDHLRQCNMKLAIDNYEGVIAEAKKDEYFGSKFDRMFELLGASVKEMKQQGRGLG